MKKLLALLLVTIMAVALFAGCNADNTTDPTATPSGTVEPSTDVSVKTGLAIINSLVKSKDAGEEEGLAEVDSTIVAVTVDNDGVIMDCVIDMVQTKVNFNASGEITTPLDTEFLTKNDLGDEYGMKANSSIGKEWYEEAAALAAYVEGKTVEEVMSIAVDESGHATDADLTASVTVSITGYLAAIEKAVANAVDYGASATDTISVGTVTNIAKSENAGEEDGLVQAYSTYIAVTKDADGVITSCIIDASQGNVNFDATGKITTDLTVAPMTKDEIGFDYGMKNASSIGKEWFEQAASFALYVTGKTAAEVEGIAVSEGYAADEDLFASVTIHITDFKAALAKALA